MVPDTPSIMGQQRCIVTYVSRYPNFQVVKDNYQDPGVRTQDIDILNCKWEYVYMDFVVGLLRTRRQHDYIWVIVDRFTKSAYLLPVKVSYSVEDYAKFWSKIL